MQTQTVTLLFWLYKSKKNKSGKSPIYLRITFQGKKFQLSTGQFVLSTEWDRSKQRVKGNSASAKLANMVLEKLKNKVMKIQTDVFLREGEISFEHLRSALSGNQQPNNTLMVAFQKHNERILSLIGNGYAKASYELYEITKNEVQEFLRSKLSRQDIPLSELNIQFIQDLEVFYRLEKGNQTNTIYKKFQRLNKIVNQAVVHGQINVNPLKAYRVKKEKKDIVYLTEKELTRIQKLNTGIQRLEIVKRLFLLSCFTGLAYNELYRLTEANIEKSSGKITWIKMQRQKTDKWLRIPLLPQSEKLIEELKNYTPYLSKSIGRLDTLKPSKFLPVPTNQKVNAYLKEIADLARIDKKLTSHVARKTFATTITLLKGVSIETVSEILGHSSIRTTQEAYSIITQEKVTREFKKLKSKFKS